MGLSWGISPSRYYRYYLSGRLTGKRHVLGKLEKRMQAFREEDCSKFAVHVGERFLFMEKEILFPGRTCDFQGVQAMIPGKASEYLTQVYGDEWTDFQFPAEEDAQRSATVEGISYQELREDYLPGIRKGRLQRAIMHSKLRILSGTKDSGQEESEGFFRNVTGIEQEKDLERFRHAIADYAGGKKPSAKETALPFMRNIRIIFRSPDFLADFIWKRPEKLRMAQRQNVLSKRPCVNFQRMVIS